MTIEIASIQFVQVEVASIQFVQTEVTNVERIDMQAVLLANSMWLVLEGFLNGYVATEDGVDRLHILLHQELAGRIN
jgi:hypothetical protein